MWVQEQLEGQCWAHATPEGQPRTAGVTGTSGSVTASGDRARALELTGVFADLASLMAERAGPREQCGDWTNSACSEGKPSQERGPAERGRKLDASACPASLHPKSPLVVSCAWSLMDGTAQSRPPRRGPVPPPLPGCSSGSVFPSHTCAAHGHLRQHPDCTAHALCPPGAHPAHRPIGCTSCASEHISGAPDTAARL